ncbi:unnamed protein product [Rotaria sp. Silwood2]|nr:unnamed protein product [Rotaria sp. Silwood2]
MSLSQQSTGRGHGQPGTQAVSSVSSDDSSSVIPKTSDVSISSITDNVQMLTASRKTPMNSGRGRGAHLKQKTVVPDPGATISDLTIGQFKSNDRPTKPNELGKIGNHIKVMVNYFPIVEFPHSGLVYQYDIQIKSKNSFKVLREHRRVLYQCWLNEYCKTYRQLNKYKIVFDNHHIIFTIDQPFPNIDETEITEKIMAPNRFNRQEEYQISIKRVGNAIDLSLLHFLNEFYDTENNSNVNVNDIRIIQQVLSIVLHENCSSNAAYIYNRSFFAQPILKDKHGYWDLGLGKALWRGFYSCLVFANGTHRLLMNLDMSHTIFMKEQSFIDFLCEVMLHSTCGKNHYKYKQNVHKAEMKDVLKFLDQNINGNDYHGEIEFLLNHCKRESSSQQTFLWKRHGRSDVATVEYYFKENYGIPLKYPTLPTLIMHNKAFVPMELVDVQPIKVKKITDEQRALLCLKSSMIPSDYHQSIMEIRQNSKQQCFEKDSFVKAWNLNVDVNMLQVTARILPMPEIIYTDNFHVNDESIRLSGVWSNTKTQFHRPTNFPSVWALINLSVSLNRKSCEAFYEQLRMVAVDRGINCPEPVLYEEYNVQPDSISQMIVALKEMMEKNNDCKFFIVILPENNNIRDQIYGDIKKLCELESGFGIVSQMIKLKENESNNQWNYSRLNSILMKINTKLDGVNSILHVPDVIKEFFLRGHRYMYVGVDLSHGAPSSGRKFSTVAVVASADDIPNRYFKEIYVQERLAEARRQSREYVVDMKQIMTSLISQYEKCHGYPPLAIVIYRDGISNSEFDSVFEKELMAIREACVELSPIYQPYLTYIVVNKKHHTRLFPTDSNGNVKAGTVVDSHEVTNPTTYDFFLNSHHTEKGTSRPTHYHVLYDDNKLKPDQVEMLTYALCYTCARCTRSISIPAPVKYADLLAFHANLYIKSFDQLDTESDIPVNQTVNVDNMIRSKRIVLSYGRGGSLVGKLEEATHIDLNKDGRIGRGFPSFSNYHPPYNPYGGPPHPPNFNQSGNPSLINELEKATNVDLNHDGRIGGGPPSFSNYPPPYNPYGGPPHPPNFNQSGNPSLINELEKATNVDLNHDGRIGGGPPSFSNYPQPYNPYGGPPFPPNFNQSGNPGLINELERATNIDLNHDGRIGGGPPSFSNYPPPYNPHGGPPYPPNFNQSGNPSLINELEKATNIDLNHDGRIGGGPAPFHNYNPYSY